MISNKEQHKNGRTS